MDNVIHLIDLSPVDSTIGFSNTYLLDSDLLLLFFNNNNNNNNNNILLFISRKIAFKCMI